MGIYVALEDKALDDTISKILTTETWSATPTGRADSRVFESSKELFIALRKSFKRATPLHMPAVLHDLHRVWGKHLKAYAKRVLESLPKVPEPSDLSQAPTCTLDFAAQGRVAAVINT